MCWALGHVSAKTVMDAEWDPAHWDLAVSYTVHIMYDTEYTLEYIHCSVCTGFYLGTCFWGGDGKGEVHPRYGAWAPLPRKMLV